MGLNMKILVIGSGGREHAIIRKLKENISIDKIYAAPGNGGISMDAQCVNIKASDIDGVLSFVKENSIDFVVVTPDDPLALGMVDALEKANIPSFGPRANAAIIESSKVFSKELMKKYGIPTAAYETFGSSEEALKYINNQNRFPLVIKADGLALGKGVIIAKNKKEAYDAVNSMMNDKIFGEAGNNILIEEFITGPEVSVLAFTDGKVVKPMVSAMDHKRVFDDNTGPNTGGMGTISPNPYYTDDIAKLCMDEIFIKTINAMNAEGRPFKGCLFFGLMITKDGPKVIEYNARFGDPETQVVIPRLKTDLFEIFKAVNDEKLSDIEIKWDDGACACVVMASKGYPGKYTTSLPIEGLSPNGQHQDATIYHAGTKYENDEFLTSGGRVLGVTAKGDTLETALDEVYSAIKSISFTGAHYRKDIGKC
jgi:phosphoribosylamine---glycine ligase